MAHSVFNIITGKTQQKRQEEAAERAEELAREQQQTAIAEQRRLEEKYSLTPGELSREQRLLGIPQGKEAIPFAKEGLEAQRQRELERRAGLTGEELLRETGPETRRLLDEISRRFGMTGEELFKAEGALPAELAQRTRERFGLTGEELFKREGEIPRVLSEQILAEARAPEKFYESTLAPELELTRQMINAEANRRGVFGGLPEGGIRFEQLGRTGVDLAIKSAQGRLAQRQTALSNAMALADRISQERGITQDEAFRLVSGFTNLGAAARGEAGTVAERALTSKERASAELAQFLQDLQTQSASAKGRAASAGIGAAQITQPSVARSYENLMGIEGFRGGIQGPAEAGLGAIGQIGTDYLLSKLFQTKTPTIPSEPTKPTRTTTPSTYEELIRASELSSPTRRLSDITGADFFEEYGEPTYRRRKQLV